MTGMPETLELNIGELTQRKLPAAKPVLSRLQVLQFVLVALCAMLLVACFVYGVRYVQQPHVLPIKQVMIKGQFDYLDKEGLASELRPYAAGGFFSLDVKTLMEKGLASPWVKSVDVRRVWPEQLEIVLTEHVPFAYWGNDSLISVQGAVFTPVTLPRGQWPKLIGPQGQSVKVRQMYEYSRGLLEPMGLKVEQVELDARRSWTIQLSDNVKLLLGREHDYQRLTRFVQVQSALAKDWANIASIDMRYTNGFAVGYKAQTEL